MSIYRTYFSKSSTLIFNNALNTSQNPVTELVYGSASEFYTRFIFKLDTSKLIDYITGNSYSLNQVTSHYLNLTNTINYRKDLINSEFSDGVTKRANSVRLQLFTVDEDWDEGRGFDIIYDTGLTITANYYPDPVNWFERKTNTTWTNEGVYAVTGTTTGNTLGVSGTTIISEFDLELGNENIKVDITDYINSIVFSGATHYGIGIAYTPEFEQLRTTSQLGIAFHTNKTNTFFEPFVETTIDDNIVDDRRYFYQDKDNRLYLYAGIGNNLSGVTVNSVKIYDYKNVLISTLTGTSITTVKNGIYYVSTTINSAQYPDAVNFKDVWNVTVGSKTMDVTNKFFIVSYDKYYTFNVNNTRFLNKNNFSFSFAGISLNERIIRGEKRKIFFNVKELYKNDLRIEKYLKYRVFIKHGTYDIDVVPYTNVNKLDNSLYIDLDTTWMIQNEYYMEALLVVDGVTYTKNIFKFFVV